MNLEERARDRIKELQQEFNISDNRTKELQRELTVVDQKKRDIYIKIEELTTLLRGKGSEIPDESKQKQVELAVSKVESGIEKLKETITSKDTKATILKILNENPTQYFKATELSEELKKRGVTTASTKFLHVVRTTLNGLRKKGKLSFIVGDGNAKHYTSLKNPTLLTEKNQGGTLELIEDTKK